MLHRRRFLTAATRGLALGGAALLAARGAQAQPSYTVPLAQLQSMVDPKFPRSVPVQGLFNLTVQTPHLRLLPEVNRLGAAMALDVAGPALRRSYLGSLDVEFALRYEASDRTLRAHQIQLGRMEFPSLRPAVNELLNAYGPQLAEQSLREVTLHQLRPQDTAVFDGLGLQPGPITVTAKGLTVAFVSRRPESLTWEPARSGGRFVQIGHQITSRMAGRVGSQLFWGTHTHHGATTRAALGPHVDEPVGGFDHIEVVFDDDDGVARIAQLVQHFQQQVDVGKVQAGGGLVQDVERAAGVALG